MNDDINKLIEFGLGIGIAQQMVKTMNHALQNTQNTVSYGVGVSPMPQSKQFYAVLQNKVAGPFSEFELSQLISQDKIQKDTYVWRFGLAQWQPAENVPDVMKFFVLTPPRSEKRE